MSVQQQCFLCGQFWEVGCDGPIVATLVRNGEELPTIWMHGSCYDSFRAQNASSIAYRVDRGSVECVRTLFLPDGWTQEQLHDAIASGAAVAAGKETSGYWINVVERPDGSWERIVEE